MLGKWNVVGFIWLRMLASQEELSSMEFVSYRENLLSLGMSRQGARGGVVG
jgi:hypothetical protein